MFFLLVKLRQEGYLRRYRKGRGGGQVRRRRRDKERGEDSRQLVYSLGRRTVGASAGVSLRGEGEEEEEGSP